MRCEWTCIDKPLSILFARLGRFVARHPLLLFFGPLLVTGILGTGFYRFQQILDVEYLFTPEHGRAKAERDTARRLFPRTEDFDPVRNTEAGLYVRFIITPKGKTNILDRGILEEILEVHNQVFNFTVYGNDEQEYKFQDLCAKWKGKCVETNPLLYAIGYNSSNIDRTRLSYPFHQITATHHVTLPNGSTIYHTERRPIFLGNSLGGIRLDAGGSIISSTAAQLVYYLNEDLNPKLGKTWEKQLTLGISLWNLSRIDITYFTSHTLETELEHNREQILPLFRITIVLLIAFSMLSSMTQDWVRSKPWLGLLGVMCAGLAVLSTFGLFMYIGVPFNDIVASMPFLVLGTGVDNMYIMIATWRQTDPREPVEERLGLTYADAAISITITTVTDVISFAIGASTDFPSVKVFCLYSGVAVLFTYLYQLTFFGACMVITGHRENASRHCLTFNKVKPRGTAEKQNKAYWFFCASGTPKVVRERDDLNPHFLMMFFRDYYAKLISFTPTKIIVLLCYGAYLTGAIWGCTKVKEGIEFKTFAADDSQTVVFYESEEEFFSHFGPKIQIIIEEKMNYWEPAIQRDYRSLFDEFLSHSDYFDEKNSECWLWGFLKLAPNFTKNTSSGAFTNLLKNRYFSMEERYKQDVVFDAKKGTDIIATRFFIQAININSSIRERRMMELARNIAEKSNLSVTVYHPAFIYYDQYLSVIPNTLMNLGIAWGAMLLVSLLFIPNPISSFWVALSVASIEVGVIGYVTLWDVRLDYTTMINLIICIGFSIDFSAHMAYVFVSAEGSVDATSDEMTPKKSNGHVENDQKPPDYGSTVENERKVPTCSGKCFEAEEVPEKRNQLWVTWV
ncbi:patched domain-containing protein 3-like [Lingula anatina]|uniref:Patched domain-containing protein 3-like n=1 Tax=Lingula anatina TaxID=7574 RepID=A0A1S3JJI9_LINAN|nr:patched domain-containing protein 3-like [Lingula anatina]|eukprot:XP_013410296.1 patched domain-containing protein 3-like [Lingula anatina]